MPKSKKKWQIDGLLYEAHTKSEARSLAKKKLNLTRLPVGQNVVRVDQPEILPEEKAS